MERKMKLKTRMILAFLAIGLIFIVSTALNAFSIIQIRQAADVQVGRVVDERIAIEFRAQIGTVYSYQADLIINGNPDAIASHRQASAKLMDYLQKLRAEVDTVDETTWINRLESEAEAYVNLFDKVVEIHNRKAVLTPVQLAAQFTAIDDETDEHKAAMFELITKIVDSFQEEFQVANAELESAVQQANTISIVLGVIVVIIGLIIVVVIFRVLRNTINEVKESALSVSLSTAEISQGNQDLSVRTQEQAAQLDGVFNTVERISGNLEQSVQIANQSEQLSLQTLNIVHNGNTVVAEMMSAMREITDSNRSISEIIGKVNDIAFQTNLLALNAAVEAARAGDQGRGFAVVAAEVRNLAGRSAEFAKDIATLVQQNISKVETGNELMTETKKSFNDIVANTGHTVDKVKEIANTLRDQARSANSLRSIVIELNDVTQQNASLVEEIASSSESMNKQAEKMSKQADVFE